MSVVFEGEEVAFTQASSTGGSSSPLVNWIMRLSGETLSAKGAVGILLLFSTISIIGSALFYVSATHTVAPPSAPIPNPFTLHAQKK